jgi:hypothetical protein
MIMLKRIGLVVVGLALIASLGACAKQAEPYGIPPGGPHFASWSHLQFSTRGGEKPRLTKQELQLAKSENWWGTPVRFTVDELE